MFPYWLIFSLFAIGALEQRRPGPITSRSAPLLGMAGLLAALMIGLRYEVGADWDNYLSIFHAFHYIEFGKTIVSGDPAYDFVNWLVLQLGLEIWAVNLICASIFVWGLISFAKAQPSPWLACLVATPYLLIVVAMGYTRQAVAIGFILAALTALDRQRLAKFIIYMTIAVAFHKTAIVIVPLVALSWARGRLLVGGMLLTLGVLFYYVFLQSSLDRLVTNYVEAEYTSQGAGIRVAMNLGPALLFLLYGKRFNLSELQHKIWRNASYASFLMLALLVLMSASTVVDRLALYLIPLQILVLSRLPEAFAIRGRANGQVLFAVIAYSALVQFVWLNYAHHAEYWVPYKLYPFSEAYG